MPMPTPEEQVTMAEIVRQLKDFREEFRGAIGTMMRQDVYRAEQATLRAEIEAQKVRFETQIKDLSKTVQTLEDEKKQKGTMVYGALLSGLVALAVAFFKK
jgi:hypothetical protein